MADRPAFYTILASLGFAAAVAIPTRLSPNAAGSPETGALPPVSGPGVDTVVLLPARTASRNAPFDVAHTLLWRLLIDSTVQAPVGQSPSRYYVRRDSALRRALCHHQLRILIATVPDPVDSHLDWMYDLHVAAIRWGLATAKYVPDAFWMPWGTTTRPEGVPNLESGTRTPREALPGVMLFRQGPRDSSIVVVYLVGESPATGVRKLAFRTAVAERATLLRLAPRDSLLRCQVTLCVIGPTFAGSAPSLAAVLSSTEREHAWRDASIITGSVPQEGIRNTLDNPPHLTFAATIHSDSAFDQARDELIVDRLLGCDQRKLAVLSERSTTAGRDSFLHVRLPPTIATLREAYEGDAPASTGLAMPGESRSPVPLSLHDSSRESEFPGPTSGLTDPTVDEDLEEIARMLRTRGVRVVQLTEMDVRDNLVLAEDLRHRVPDIQILTYGRHSLYARPDRSTDLAGMLVLSTYPPGLRNQGRMIADRSDPNRRLVFPTDGAEGTYNATLLQLGDSAALVDYRWPFVAKDSPARSQPPIWLSIVGSGDLVPLAAFGGADTARHMRACSAPASTQAAAAPNGISSTGGSATRKDHGGIWDSYMYAPTSPSRLSDQRTPRLPIDPLPAYGAILLGMIVIWVAWKDRPLWSRGIRRISGAPGHGSSGAKSTLPILNPPRAMPFGIKGPASPIKTRSSDGALGDGRIAYGVVGLLSISMAFVAGLAAVRNTDLDVTWTTWVVRLVLMLISVVCVAIPFYGYVVALRRGEMDGHTDDAVAPRTIDARWYPGLGRVFEVLVTAWCAAVLWWFVWPVLSPYPITDGGNQLLAARVAAIHSGVSPVLPFVLIGLGQCMWARWNLGRIQLIASEPNIGRWLTSRSPAQPQTHDSTEPQSLLARLGIVSHDPARTGKELVDPMPSMESSAKDWKAKMCDPIATGGAWVLFVFLLVAACLYGSLLFRQPAEIIGDGAETGRGLWGFGSIFTLGVLAGMAAPIWISYRLFNAWGDLHGLLQTMEGTRICSAFERLPTFAARITQLSVFGGKWTERQDVLGVVGEIQWRHLKNLNASLGGHRFAAVGLSSNDAMARLVAVYDIIKLLWKAEPEATVVGIVRQLDTTVPHRQDTGAFALQSSTTSQFRRSFPTDIRLWLRAGEEWIAVQIVAYVEWAIEYLRHMAQYLLLSMIITTLLFASYPFYPRAHIERVFFAEMIGAVILIIIVLTEISRDEVIAAISNTTPGRVSWDRDFVLNLLLIIAVPLVTILSVLFPPVREFLFAWVRPWLGTIGGRV